MSKGYSSKNIIGLILAPSVFIFLLFDSPIPNASPEAQKAAALGILMAILWVTEAIPIPATAMLPIALLPLLGIGTIKSVTTSYGHPLIFLFLGGFILAIAMQKWNLHKRIALSIMKFTGTDPKNLVIGFMISTAFLSMWVSNTATVVMMYPIAMSIIQLLENTQKNPTVKDCENIQNFSIALMLCLAYSANIGGVGTLIGTPPNALLAAYLSENFKFHIGFGQWMLLGIPIVIIFLPLTYLLITKILYPIHVGKTSGSDEIIQTEIKSLGKMSLPEVVVSLIELVMASLWIFRPLLQSADWSQNIDAIQSLSDEGIAIIGATLLFAAPISLRKSQFLIDWSDTKELPWGILILFGGGLALAKSFQDTGLTTTIGSLSQHISDIPISLFVFVICAIMIFLTELTSNTATTASFLPVLGAMAVGMGEDPALLTIPVAIVASCAFMLPVATPPNAVVFASGKISLPQMAKTGLWLNILSVVLIPSIFLLLYSLIF